VLLVTGYDRDRIGAVADGELAPERLRQHGAAESVRATHRLAFSLSKRKVVDDQR
jgi:hypothetical protein